MKKRVLGTILSVSMVVGMLAGCGQTADQAADTGSGSAKTETTETKQDEAVPTAENPAAAESTEDRGKRKPQDDDTQEST